MDTQKLDERRALLQDQIDFINECNQVLASEKCSVDLSVFDLDNPVSLSDAQNAQALASQYVSALAERVDHRYFDFVATSDLLESLFRDFYIQFLEINPRQRGYPEELHQHAASKAFQSSEGWDRDLAHMTETKYKQIQKTLSYRREHLSEVHFQLKEKLKTLSLTQVTQGGSQIISPGSVGSFTDLSQSPSQRVPLFPGAPPPALAPAPLPRAFQQS